jgi:hypothetical protein
MAGRGEPRDRPETCTGLSHDSNFDNTNLRETLIWIYPRRLGKSPKSAVGVARKPSGC